jgi:hypothetical protein
MERDYLLTCIATMLTKQHPDGAYSISTRGSVVNRAVRIIGRPSLIGFSIAVSYIGQGIFHFRFVDSDLIDDICYMLF